MKLKLCIVFAIILGTICFCSAQADRFNLPEKLYRVKFGKTSEWQIRKLFGNPSHVWREHPRGSQHGDILYYDYDNEYERFGFSFSSNRNDTTNRVGTIDISCASNFFIAKSLLVCASTLDQVMTTLGEPDFKGGMVGHPELIYITKDEKKWQYVFSFDAFILHGVRIGNCPKPDRKTGMVRK